jgi:hypothetical protein
MTMIDDVVALDAHVDWVVPVPDPDGERTRAVHGRIIGYATSRRDKHVKGCRRNGVVRCFACRWFEVRIVRTDDDWYVVVYVGESTVAGETARRTVTVTQSPYVVIEVLTQRRDGNLMIPRTSRVALAEAAARDEGIEMVWIDRAVS